MKRSRSIHLSSMRQRGSALKPLAVAVAASGLAACGGSSQEALIYQDAAHCKTENPNRSQDCEVAYQEALKTAAESGPKYSSNNACQHDFGNYNCQQYSTGGNNWFVPLVSGFMLAKVIDHATGNYYYRGAPLYTSGSPYSPYYNRWTTVDGWDYGYRRYGSVRTSTKAFDPKPKVSKTISRGGFGSKAATKSSWGGSSKGSWGG